MATMPTAYRTSTVPNYFLYPNIPTEKKRLICVVCGSIARGYNFGAITCMSCKIFFRRNAYTNLSGLHCHAGGNCEINQQTRKCCTYCRLLRCFRVGMKRQLFRIKENTDLKWSNIDERTSNKGLKLTSSMYSQEIQNQLYLPKYPSIVGSFEPFKWTQSFQLTNHDWMLINKLSYNFDSLNYYIEIKANEIYQQLLSIGVQPLKMRAKAFYIYDVINTLAETGLKFFQSIPQFMSLPITNKRALLMRNARSLIMFYAHYQMNFKPLQTILETPYWQASLDFILLPSTIYLHHQVKYHIGRISLGDPYLVKLILVIIAFSANNADHNDITISQKLDENYHGMILNKIQNMYVELLWKYMIHRFGENQSIHHFLAIIETILRSERAVFTFDNSIMPFEHKFYENFVKSINKSL